MFTEIMENDDHLLENEIRFHHNGASSHLDVRVTVLGLKFWSGRRGPVEWPSTSLDLTPVDFFL